MSVSWQPSHHASVPVGVRLGGPSTSSSDYGNWFQPKTFPAPPLMNPSSTGQRRIPTRKLGALAISDHLDGGGGQNGGGAETMDQTGRVNSFLNKVTQEGRVPRSPATPEMLDLPGRIVRAPRTRHMTPRNSPDAARHAEINGNQEGSYHNSGPNTYNGVSSQGANGHHFMPSPRHGMERSNTMVDLSPRVHGELATSTTTSQALRQQNPFTLQRANTMMPQGNNTNQYVGNNSGQFSQFQANSTGSNQYQRPLQPISGFPQYVIPQYPMERSSTMLNFNTSTGSNPQFNPSSNSVGPNDNSPRLLGLQRATTNLDGSKFSQAPGGSGANVNDQTDNRVSWSFRRVPSFHGNLPGSQNGIMRRPLESFQPAEEQTAESAQNKVLSRYMFSTLPDSNAKKHSADGVDMGESIGMKPRIPMYWLYGSRGRPGSMNREDLINTGPWVPANSPRDQFSQPGHNANDTSPGIAPLQQGQAVSLNNLSESDFLATSTDRRDAYRSNYSSYNDQRTTQSEPDKSEFEGRFRKEDSTAAVEATDTASLPDESRESRKYRSILKKHSSYAGTAVGAAPRNAAGGGTYPMRAAPGGRLPHMGLNRRGASSKRVSFAL